MSKLFVGLMFLPWVLISAMTFVSPISYGPRSALAIVTIALSTGLWGAIAFLVGSRRSNYHSDLPRLRKLSRCLGLFFWLFIALSYSNFFLLESRSLFTLVQDRELANIEGPSPTIIGGITGILASSPAFYLALKMILGIRNRMEMIRVVLLALFAVPPLLFSGGRNPLVLTTLFLLVVRAAIANLDVAAGARASMRGNVYLKRLIQLGLLFLIVLYMANITVARLSLGDRLDDYASILATHYGVAITPVYEAVGAVGTEVAVVFASLYYYISHGVVMFDRMLQDGNVALTWGLSTFPLYSAIGDFVFGTGMTAILAPRIAFPGSYLSIFGSAYQDFGYVGLVILLVTVSVLIVTVLSSSRYGAIRIYWFSFMATAMLVAPVYAITNTGFGSSMLFVLIVLTLVMRVKLGVGRHMGDRYLEGRQGDEGP